MFERFAHVKWFVEDTPPAIDSMSTNEWLVTFFAVFGLVSLLYWLNSKWKTSAYNKLVDKKLGKFEWLVPILLRFSIGPLLIINAAHDVLYAPNVPITNSKEQYISYSFVVLGIMLIAGILPRIAGGAITVLFLLSILSVHPLPNALDHIEYIGVGLYTLLRGGGRFCLLDDRFSVDKYAKYAKDCLRIFVGLDLMQLALSEKLAGIGFSNQFLEFHEWNFLHDLGLSDRNFIILAGIVEFTVGLALVLNLASRITTVVVLILMTITAYLLGIDEVYGHLFAISLVAVVWLDSSSKKDTKVPKKRVSRKNS